MAQNLRRGIDSSVTTIPLNATSEFPASGGVVLIGSERILFGSSSVYELRNCTRGYAGTTAATHLAGVAITSVTDASGVRSFSGDSAETLTPDATGPSTVTIAVNAALTINGPTGGIDGQKMTLRLVQDGTGHAVTFATGAGNFAFGATITAFTASAASLTDYVGCIYNSSANRWQVVSVVQGF